MADASRRPRPGLTPGAIVDAALDVVRSDGLDALSMRRLAQELRTAPMSLYRHVSDKRELLILMLEKAFAGLPALPEEPAARDRLVAIWLTVHDYLAGHPWVVELLARGELFAPSAMRLFDTVVGLLRAEGLPLFDATAGYAAMWNQVIGRVAAVGTAGERLELIRRSPLDRLPHAREVYGESAGFDSRAVFVRGLEMTVEGVLARAYRS